MDYPQYSTNLLIRDVLAHLDGYAHPCVFAPTLAAAQPPFGLQSTALHHGDFNGDPATTASIASRGTSKPHARGQFKTARLGLSDYCRSRWLRAGLRLPIAGCQAVLV
jgi:hypothetical protein